METLTLDEMWNAAERRLQELGWDTPEWQERLRNKGGLRSPEKREMLARIEERARAAGLEPLKAY